MIVVDVTCDVNLSTDLNMFVMIRTVSADAYVAAVGVVVVAADAVVVVVTSFCSTCNPAVCSYLLHTAAVAVAADDAAVEHAIVARSFDVNPDADAVAAVVVVAVHDDGADCDVFGGDDAVEAVGLVDAAPATDRTIVSKHLSYVLMRDCVVGSVLAPLEEVQIILLMIP